MRLTDRIVQGELLDRFAKLAAMRPAPRTALHPLRLCAARRSEGQSRCASIAVIASIRRGAIIQIEIDEFDNQIRFAIYLCFLQADEHRNINRTCDLSA